MSSTGVPAPPALYVSPLAPSTAAYRVPQAVLMSESSAEEAAKRAWLARLEAPSWGSSRDVAAAGALGREVPVFDAYGQPDSRYDWRMNQKDWRFQLLSMIPFGLLFIAVSLQSSKRAELLEEADECEIATMNGLVPPEQCRQAVAMAAVDGRMGSRIFGD
jgi:hypothetical protein